MDGTRSYKKLRAYRGEGQNQRKSLFRRSRVLSNLPESQFSTEEEDDLFTTPRTIREARLARSTRNKRLSIEQDSNEGQSMGIRRSTRRKSVRFENEDNWSRSLSGVRRSTRQKKLKFPHVNDSWLLASQSPRGYPTMDYSEDASYENGEVKEELEEEGEEEEEEEEEEDTGEAEKDQRVEQDVEEDSKDVDSGQPPVENFEGASLAEAGGSKERPTRLRRRISSNEGRSRNEENGVSSNEEEAADRSKRRSFRLAKQQELNEMGSSESSSSSDDDSSAMDRRPVRGTRASARRAVRKLRSHQNVEVKKYHLRQTKPMVDRFQIPPPEKEKQIIREIARSMRRRRRRSSSSSSSSSSSADKNYDRKRDRYIKRRELAGGEKMSNSSKLADVAPMAIDHSIRFSNIGGLEKHIECLKEMVLFPIWYPELFTKFNVTPPKGILFYGPPGTGKTLLARALANECSQGGKRVTFFMRKGADCLSKWVGESERQLRILFQEAYQNRPSIIFFDELDGLAPVRSSKQDQIHASIVCTLLALMDGMDSRGDIIIIGATNRIDSIDPALRRPGRFDRELHFPLPGVKERREILKVHAAWAEESVLNKMAEDTVGYCGSDLKSLVTEGVIRAVQRVYPQIYGSDKKLLLDKDRVKVKEVDFEKARRNIVPASQRAFTTIGRKMPQYLEPILSEPLGGLLSYVGDVFPIAFNRSAVCRVARSPRLLLVGNPRVTSVLSTGLLYKLEHCPILSMSFETLFAESSTSPEEKVTRVFKELPHSSGSILWFGDISLWWQAATDSVKAVFTSLYTQLDPSLPILFLATSASHNLPKGVRSIFKKKKGEVYTIPHPTREQLENFFRPLFRIKALKPPPPPKMKKEELEPLPIAPPTPPPQLTDEQKEEKYKDEENTLRELRIFLRQICAKLARNRQFYMFSKPVDITEVPDYLEVIKEPMDLETMMTKIDLQKYTCAEDFLKDIDLLCLNALEYNPDRDPADKLIRHRACYLKDTAYALIKAEMDSDFEINCRSIRDVRKQREQSINQLIDPKMDQDNQNVTAESSDGKSADRKKRKKRTNWSKGVIKKSKKNSQQDAEGNSFEDSKDSKGERSREESEHREETEPPINGNVSESSIDDHSSKKEITKIVTVDRNALNQILETAVKATEKLACFDRILDAYWSFSNIVEFYSTEWDRSKMITELTDVIKVCDEDSAESPTEDEST